VDAVTDETAWLIDRIVPGAGNRAVLFQVAGAVSERALRRAVRALVDRHDALRTVFRGGAGGLRREVIPPGEVRVEVAGLERREETAEAAAAGFVATPFRPDGGLLVRAAHQRRADGDVVCLALHPSIFDEWSTEALLDDLVGLYEAADVPPPRSALETEQPEGGQEAYWKGRLAGFRADGQGLLCQRQNASITTMAGAEASLALSERARSAVSRLRRDLGEPEETIALAAYQLLLAAHGAGPDLLVGVPADRRAHGRGIGRHGTVLPVRVPVAAGQTFRAFAGRVTQALGEAKRHRDIAVERLTRLVPRPDAARPNTLARHTFSHLPTDAPIRFTIDGCKAVLLTPEARFSLFDLELLVTPDGARAVFSTELFRREDVELLLARYDALLARLGAAPDERLDERAAWCDSDRAVIGAANATGRAFDPSTVLAAVADTVRERPDAVAVEEGERATTYAGLWAAATTVRDRLRGVALGDGDVVALAARRGADLAAAALGTWLAGATYLPLDTAHPAQRIAYQLADSGARAVLAGPEFTAPDEARNDLTVIDLGTTLAAAPRAAPAPPPDAGDAVRPDGPAYVIYTSGSTGRPKGTLVGHDALANLVHHFADELAAGPGTGTLWLTTFSFDISALELFLPLVGGGRVVAAPDEARTDGGRLAAVLREHRVDVLQATPTTWRLVVEQVGGLLAGTRVLTGGEPLPAPLARRLAATGCRLRNVYGPTETTIWSTSGVIEAGAAQRVDVGSPIANTVVFVTGPDGRELPLGLYGELCIAGRGLAIGYHGRPELTAERFGRHDIHGRYYRTGDVARWLPDGKLEVLGRLDRQVKIRGNRIELGEVEGVLLEHPAVRAVAVVADDSGGDTALAAFVVAADRPGPPAAASLRAGLWEHARTALPVPAIPQEFHFVDGFPETGNGKVDYPAMVREAARLREEGPTRTGDERGGDGLARDLIGLWNELLRRRDADSDSHFFANGGNSLLGAALLQRIERAAGVELRLNDLFESPTPTGLAGRIREIRGAAGGRPEDREGTGPATGHTRVDRE
jgi:amino acid adenylation domain-containing protein